MRTDSWGQLGGETESPLDGAHGKRINFQICLPLFHKHRNELEGKKNIWKLQKNPGGRLKHLEQLSLLTLHFKLNRI
jgi:hypothetical protein